MNLISLIAVKLIGSFCDLTDTECRKTLQLKESELGSGGGGFAPRKTFCGYAFLNAREGPFCQN